MHRFFIDHIDGETATLTDAEQVHHLKNVLRLKPGDAVVLADGAGNEYYGDIGGVGKEGVAIEINLVKPARPPKVTLTVACAIPKGNRLDETIDHLTQLGAARLIPMVTERVTVKPDKAGAAGRVERWRKIAKSAAMQSQRRRLPEITPVTGFEEVVKQSGNYDVKLIPHLTGERRTLPEALSRFKTGDIIVLIGPEGDFTAAEVKLALDSGFTAVTLGETVLRVATAAVAAAAYIHLMMDN